jgi:hypothetical protein
MAKNSKIPVCAEESQGCRVIHVRFSSSASARQGRFILYFGENQTSSLSAHPLGILEFWNLHFLHQHSFLKKNTIISIYTIYKYS